MHTYIPNKKAVLLYKRLLTIWGAKANSVARFTAVLKDRYKVIRMIHIHLLLVLLFYCYIVISILFLHVSVCVFIVPVESWCSWVSYMG